MENKLDLKEIDELFDFMDGVLKDIIESKEDGEISIFETLQIALGNAPAAYMALVGMDLAILEAKDLDKDEAKHLAKRSLETGKLMLQIFSKGG